MKAVDPQRVEWTVRRRWLPRYEVGRLVFRRPWTVEACSATGQRHEARVVGWRRAGETVRAMARDIEYGNPIGTSQAATE